MAAGGGLGGLAGPRQSAVALVGAQRDSRLDRSGAALLRRPDAGRAGHCRVDCADVFGPLAAGDGDLWQRRPTLSAMGSICLALAQRPCQELADPAQRRRDHLAHSRGLQHRRAVGRRAGGLAVAGRRRPRAVAGGWRRRESRVTTAHFLAAGAWPRNAGAAWAAQCLATDLCRALRHPGSNRQPHARRCRAPRRIGRAPHATARATGRDRPDRDRGRLAGLRQKRVA